ncbi:hypothetical protein IVA86_27380 [Bradyrhizobium sp. 146]|uniref:hypothetical protein n=1 Tax=Bradyrhizobium sp. 146 TaxID=2782622 RepID=UPI001FF87966|nr:hypothetical protein [Bradyrhizobium sp. 146]MCK1705028.1 hypothetical protein [Bradyrhizobium sp. 146]
MSTVLARFVALALKGRGLTRRQRICKASRAACHGFAKSLLTHCTQLQLPSIFNSAFIFRTAAHSIAAPRSLSATIHPDLPSSSRARIFLFFLPFLISLLAVPGVALAAPGNWSDFVTVSMTNPTTPKLISNGICYSDGTDILCDGTGGLVSGAGSIATDTIISGTTRVTANTTGYISFTTGGTTTGYMDTAGNFILPGVSTTGIISTTGLYTAGNIVISPTASIRDIYNSGVYQPNVGYTSNNNSFMGSQGGMFFAIDSNADQTTNAYTFKARTNGIIGGNTLMTIYQNGLINVSNSFVVGSSQANPSTSLLVSGTSLFTSWTAINFADGSKPTAPLEVSGTISATIISGTHYGDGSHLTGITANISVTTGSSGSLIYRDSVGDLIASSTFNISTTGSMGIGAGPPASLGFNRLYVTGAIRSGDYLQTGGGLRLGDANHIINADTVNKYMSFIVSNTEAMRIVSTGYVGIGTAYPSATLHVSGSLNVDGTASANSLFLSSGGNIPIRFNYLSSVASVLKLASNGTLYFQNSGGSNIGLFNSNGVFSVGNASVSSSLNVSGSSLITSWTAINTNAVATAPLEVSGTVSATSFYTSGTVRVGGTGGETCSTPADYGKNRYNPASGHMQVCVPR